MSSPSLQSREAGFSLIEALVATVLMAFILGAIAAVTSAWIPNWKSGVSRAQRTQLLSVGLERLVADLSAAQFVSATGSAVPYFEGSELAVTFVRTAIGPNTLPGLEIVRLYETSGRGGTTLVRATAPFSPGVGGVGSLGAPFFSNAVVLIRAPYRVSFSYAGPDRQWQDSWSGRAELPRAIRIRIRDGATATTLTVSTAALVHVEAPARSQERRTDQQ